VTLRLVTFDEMSEAFRAGDVPNSIRCSTSTLANFRRRAAPADGVSLPSLMTSPVIVDETVAADAYLLELP